MENQHGQLDFYRIAIYIYARINNIMRRNDIRQDMTRIFLEVPIFLLINELKYYFFY